MSGAQDVEYTEDGVVVKKLYIHDIRGYNDWKCLKRFNPSILRVHRAYYWRQNEYGSDKGFITFDDASDAAKALILSKQTSSFKAVPSYSWQQPDAFNFLGNCGSDPPHPILNLNDDCLGQILRLLTLSDRIRFARTYQRIRNVYQDMSKSLYESVDITEIEKLTKWEVRDFFMIFGPFVKKINGVVKIFDDDRLLKNINKNCTNLQSLEIETYYLDITNKSYSKLSEDFPVAIESLVLDNCDLIDMNYIILATDAHPELNELQIRIVNKSYKYLFELYPLSKILSSRYFSVESKFKNLKKLTVRNYVYRSRGTSFDGIKKLRALRTLYLNNRNVSDVHLSDLIFLRNLEKFILSSPLVTDEGVLKLILASLNLKVVYLYYCSRITNKLINDLDLELREEIIGIGRYRSFPILLNVFGTQITNLCLNESVADVLNIVFDKPDLNLIE